jgi:hypothetical protein
MSSPSSVQPCPEPSPYSNESYAAAEINYAPSNQPAVNSVVQNTQFTYVDSLLSNQLGPITNPVTNGSVLNYNASPVLPVVDDSNASPVLSSSLGADINNSYTLLQNENNIPVQPTPVRPTPVQPTPVQPTPVQPTPVFPVPVAPEPVFPLPIVPDQVVPAPVIPGPSTPELVVPVADTQIQSNVVPPVGQPSESFNNIQRKNPVQNLSKFIQNKQPIARREHFGSPKEHFAITTGSSVMDTLVLCLIVGMAVYYVISPKNMTMDNINQSVENVVSQIPVLSQLVDDNVSDTNKLLIVGAIVVAFIFITKMMS